MEIREAPSHNEESAATRDVSITVSGRDRLIVADAILGRAIAAERYAGKFTVDSHRARMHLERAERLRSLVLQLRP
jgi:hypothetical protein